MTCHMSHRPPPEGTGKDVLVSGEDFYSAEVKRPRNWGFTLNRGSQAYVTIQRLYALGKSSDLGCARTNSDLGQVT